MNSNAEIVPIAVATRDRDVTALIQARRDVLPRLATLEADELRELYRRFYAEAVARHMLTMINLVVRQDGAGADGQAVWHRSLPLLEIKAVYSEQAGTTRITVNHIIVCSNERAGEEVFIPGNWLAEMGDAYRRLIAQREWVTGLQAERSRETMILDLTADV